MGLSENERRELAGIENRLVREDAVLARRLGAMRGPLLRPMESVAVVVLAMVAMLALAATAVTQASAPDTIDHHVRTQAPGDTTPTGEIFYKLDSPHLQR